jgi:hypothetical protein
VARSKEKYLQILWKKSEGKISLEGSNRRRYDPIKINLKDMIWRDMARNNMAQERKNGALLLIR